MKAITVEIPCGQGKLAIKQTEPGEFMFEPYVPIGNGKASKYISLKAARDCVACLIESKKWVIGLSMSHNDSALRVQTRDPSCSIEKVQKKMRPLIREFPWEKPSG